MTKTISEEYQKLNQEHHETTKWGVASGKWFETVKRILRKNKAKTVLDYGAGKGIISGMLRDRGFEVTEYDPGVKGKQEKPPVNKKFDYVISTDVFEHIEPEFIDNVLDEILHYMDKGGFFVICLGVARKHWLSDGRNAHVLVRPRKWWMEKLQSYFQVKELPGRNWPEREMVVHVKPL